MESNTHTTTPEATKKQWITPKVEIISKDIIQIGTTPAGPEGVYNPTNVTTGSS